MNIIPFVTILILVITLTISSFFNGHKETTLAKVGTTGLINAYRLARNASETSRLPVTKKTEEKPASPKREKAKGKKSKEPTFRDNITDHSKFNLMPLIAEETPFLQEIFANLLDQLYIQTDLINDYKYGSQGLAKLLAKEIIQSAKDLPEKTPLEFESLSFKSSTLNALWYKMLQGHPNYPDEKSWPPISNLFVFLKEEPKKVLCPRKASIPLLNIFFGKEITLALLEKEKEPDRKSPLLTTEEIKQILNHHSFPIDKRECLYYNFSKKPRTTQVKQDPTTGIQATLSYSTKSN